MQLQLIPLSLLLIDWNMFIKDTRNMFRKCDIHYIVLTGFVCMIIFDSDFSNFCLTDWLVTFSWKRKPRETNLWLLVWSTLDELFPWWWLRHWNVLAWMNDTSLKYWWWQNRTMTVVKKLVVRVNTCVGRIDYKVWCVPRSDKETKVKEGAPSGTQLSSTTPVTVWLPFILTLSSSFPQSAISWSFILDCEASVAAAVSALMVTGIPASPKFWMLVTTVWYIDTGMVTIPETGKANGRKWLLLSITTSDFMENLLLWVPFLLCQDDLSIRTNGCLGKGCNLCPITTSQIYIDGSDLCHTIIPRHVGKGLNRWISITLDLWIRTEFSSNDRKQFMILTLTDEMARTWAWLPSGNVTRAWLLGSIWTMDTVPSGLLMACIMVGAYCNGCAYMVCIKYQKITLVSNVSKLDF